MMSVVNGNRSTNVSYQSLRDCLRRFLVGSVNCCPSEYAWWVVGQHEVLSVESALMLVENAGIGERLAYCTWT